MAFTNVMVDIETTGLNPEHSAILQLAGVKFDLETKQIDAGNMFCQSMLIPPGRFWDEGTRTWWGKQNPEVYQTIRNNMRDPAVVMREFADWCMQGNAGDLHFWAKPITFDYVFVDSYFKQFEVGNPFHYRNVIDLQSFLRGMKRRTQFVATTAVLEGDAHNALHDSIHQIDIVFHAMEGKFVEN